MKKNQRNSTLSWLASRRPTGTGHSAGWNAGDHEGEDIQLEGQDIPLAGMKETQSNGTYSWLDAGNP